MNNNIEKSLLRTADYFDQKKVGDSGPLGFRRSSDLSRIVNCLGWMIDQEILISGESLFLDMGCGDGRVNILFSYLVKLSIGLELDEWTLDEYAPLRRGLEETLKRAGLPIPGDNIMILKFIKKLAGFSIEGVNLFNGINAKNNFS